MRARKAAPRYAVATITGVVVAKCNGLSHQKVRPQAAQKKNSDFPLGKDPWLRKVRQEIRLWVEAGVLPLTLFGNDNKNCTRSLSSEAFNPTLMQLS
jgi:hypothetical protein